jgi:hypothetical protein
MATDLERIQQIIGCQMVNGSCRRHQRPMDAPRPGCPVAAEMIRYTHREAPRWQGATSGTLGSST